MSQLHKHGGRREASISCLTKAHLMPFHYPVRRRSYEAKKPGSSRRTQAKLPKWSGLGGSCSSPAATGPKTRSCDGLPEHQRSTTCSEYLAVSNIPSMSLAVVKGKVLRVFASSEPGS